ncbi:MAG TPA: SAM-dependent methyltransferase [Lachnospiraceae bacterium]|nr:SAM-dependent methyltransferase [Lachnospiraceae bacterium]
MISSSESWWEKKLNIRTSGKIDHFKEITCNIYEPTDYGILQRLAESGYITKDSRIVDYGCGLGRTLFYLCSRTGCRGTGIEFDRELYEGALENLDRAKIPPKYKENMRFVCDDARTWEIGDENVFYFFNPFTEEVLRIVLDRIRQSFYERPRQIHILFYYPFEAETGALMREDSMMFVDEIDCTDLYEQYDQRERILVFEMAPQGY